VRFYLGTHEPSWLRRTDVPLFISHRRLARLRRGLPEARGPWALDSGGFTELADHGRWLTSPATYAAAARRYQDEVGRLEWAAPQDWMCEPFMVDKTGLTIADHQARTVASVLELRALAPDVPFAPVLQGWELDDYLRCVDLYADAGVDLAAEPIVGIGSVCRRQATDQITTIVWTLARLGIRLHGFGVKTLGVTAYAHDLRSADSMAWSYNARRHEPLPGCGHSSCANCLRWALRWRGALLERLEDQTRQLSIYDEVPA
jgi:hypothetical protein